MKTKNLLILLFIFFSLAQLSAQTFEEFKKQRESELESFKQKQQEFIDRMQNEFDEYVKQKDQEFTDYLKTHWDEYSVFKGIDPPESPKPPVLPEYKAEPEREESQIKIPVIEPTLNVKKEVAKQIKIPLIQKTDEEEFDKSNMTFDFFGFRIILDYDQQLKFDPPAAVNPSAISKIWDMLSRTNYSELINQFQSYKTSMNLNDWAYFLMLQKFAQTVYPDSETGEDLLLWGLMNRSGFKSRIAYANDKVCLLVPSHYTIYSKSFLKTEGLNYYLMRNLGTNNIFTYDKDYPDANNLMDFAINSPINFSRKVDQKTFSFTFKDKPYSFNFFVNQNLIDFYKDYPQVDLNIYFDAPVSTETKESILESFKPIISEMTESEAVSFLLRFVQTSFKYKTDQQQFFKEKFFFPEEILFYPYSDCEDRSIFFAYLVKTLLNKKVIGIEYPGHIATAVKFSTDLKGDYIIYKGEKYIIADATFENAPIGMSMPEYSGMEGKIIEIDDYSYRAKNNKSFWEHAREAGGNRGDNLQDIVFDDSGNAYMTGYFHGEARFGEYVLQSASDQTLRNVFIAKYDKSGNVVWAKKASGNKNATGFSIILENNIDIYYSGSFSGRIEFENGLTSLQCKDELSDVFIAKYSSDGQLRWAKKAGLDTYPQENYLTYMTKYTKEGINKGTSFYSENENFGNYGLHLGPMGLVYLTGAFKSTTGFNIESLSLTTNDTRGLNLAESLKEENDRLIADNYNENIAGLFAMLNHVKYAGITISGQDAQKALDMNNAEFKKKYEELYSNIGKINYVMNEEGIITVETKDENSVSLRELKLTNGSQLKVTSFENGNAQIDVLSGISVGKLFIRFDLNFVKLYKNNGNMLFDFGSDNLRKMMNFKEDILK